MSKQELEEWHRQMILRRSSVERQMFSAVKRTDEFIPNLSNAIGDMISVDEAKRGLINFFIEEVEKIR